MIGCEFRKVSLSHWSKLRHQISPFHLTRGYVTTRRDPLPLPEYHLYNFTYACRSEKSMRQLSPSQGAMLALDAVFAMREASP
jgi:hypothetical protein